MKRAVGLHPVAQTQRAREQMRDVRGEAGEAKREAEIAALPVVTWKGHELRALKCNGDFGKGPHLMNLHEAYLWALIDFRAYRCPFHS